MVEKLSPSDSVDPPPPVAAVPRRGPGHRGADMRDTVAELAERAQIISQEAGSKVAAAMKDVISAAAGLTGFAIESARDLVQYMVRRGQMTPEEGDKLIREAEAAHDKRPASEKAKPTATKIAAEKAAAAKAEAAARAAQAAAANSFRPPQARIISPVSPSSNGAKERAKPEPVPVKAAAKAVTAKAPTPKPTAKSVKPAQGSKVKPTGKSAPAKAAKKSKKR